MKATFTLEYWVDDGWYVGRLREVPGVFSQGKTLEELEENVRDAYQLMRKEQPSIRRRVRSKPIAIPA
ncbi:MAG: type II toxin-antitoxin system HicB family antitoxin [Acidobacteria bacterium]|nr:type II toxin-antitoxin system HicB family antitoxin [Acidobacteriota bacterium]MCZ6751963.1 type II toxin-antitoxin system HicB family antitoxin [Acidobacteriota bacterium]